LERVDDIAGIRSRVGGDAKVNNLARREVDDKEGIDLPEEQVDDWEKVTGPDHLGVILEES
jgi:hypothetical protein